MRVGTGGNAPFEQLAAEIRLQIRNGTLKSGDKLPSHRDLAVQHNVAPNTAQKAVNRLADEGWVEVRGPLGSFVSNEWTERPPQPTVEELSSEVAELRGAVEDLTRRLERVEEDRS